MRWLPFALVLCASPSAAAEAELFFESDFITEAEEALEPEIEELEDRAEMESVRLDEWGEEDSWWLGRWSDLSSQVPTLIQEGERTKKHRLLSEELRTLNELTEAPAPSIPTPVRARLGLDFAHQDETAAIARPLVAVRLLAWAEFSSALTLARSRGETVVSHPETAALLHALKEDGFIPAVGLRAAIITPLSGSALVAVFGARTTKRVGPANLHGWADYIAEEHNTNLYTLGMSADTPLGQRVSVRGNVFYQGRVDQPERTLVGEGGLFLRLTSRVNFDGSVRVQRGTYSIPPHMFFSLSVI